MTVHLRQLLQGSDGFLFLPLIYRLAARLEQMDLEELSEDASAAAYALHAAQKLFQLPAVICHFRLGIEAEADPERLDAAALERGRLAVVLDATRRLAADLQGQAGVVAVITGPRTLATRFPLKVGQLADFYALLARAYAERGAQMLLLTEDAGSPPASGDAPVLTPLINVARYFRLPVALLDVQAEQRPAGIDLLAGGSGLPLLPPEHLREPPDDARAWRQRAAPLLLTQGEVPPDQPAERLLEWVAALRSPIS